MIKTSVKKWGNSLAVRLPQSVLAQLNLHVNEEVEVRVEEDKLILTAMKGPKYSLDELLEQIGPDNLHDEIDFGKPVGKEEW